MKLSDAARQFEKCMTPENSFGCLVDRCPLHGKMTFEMDSSYEGEMRWKIEGCSLMAKFQEMLRRKKPGQPFPEATEAVAEVAPAQ